MKICNLPSTLGLITMASRLFRHLLSRFGPWGLALFSLMTSQNSLAYKPEVGHEKLGQYANHLLIQCQDSRTLSQNDLTQFIEASAGIDLGRVPLHAPPEDNPFSLLKRLTHWHFSNHEQFPNGRRRGPINDSFHELWVSLKLHYERNNQDQMRYLGGLGHFIEDMANPAHMVPVFHMLGVKDGIDDYLPRYDDIRHRIEDGSLCERIESSAHSVDDVLNNIIHTTQNTLDQPIPQCDGFTWQAFFVKPKSGKFYGEFVKNKTPSPRFPTKRIKPYRIKPFYIGDAGTLTTAEGQCRFSENDTRYQAFIDQLYINAIVADAQLFQWHADDTRRQSTQASQERPSTLSDHRPSATDATVFVNP